MSQNQNQQGMNVNDGRKQQIFILANIFKRLNDRLQLNTVKDSANVIKQMIDSKKEKE
ncbi:hypothetical protein SAMN05444955_10624 [Lihuaxuella thermophila]|uniref:Uncharacterized protein n=1 Tax=Lihuaxuella thermophila TaxID=1173111 RepID=A0A1H8DXH8_9BACL|nr:hypothetical protein SAMN05444955_10624 [Lihuaxuella thermophila]